MMGHHLVLTVAALLVFCLNLVCSAPQPLSLVNSTDLSSEDPETSTEYLESKVTENIVSTTIIPSDKASVEHRSDLEDITSEVTTVPSKDNISTESSVSSELDSLEKVTTETKPNDAVSFVKYVPPLDPMKHMLMMAEKIALNISKDVETTESVPITTKPSTTLKEEFIDEISVPNSADSLESSDESTSNESSTLNLENDVVKKSGDISTDVSVDKTETSSIAEEIPEKASSTESLVIDVSSPTSTDLNNTGKEDSSVLLNNAELFSEKREDISSSNSPELTSTTSTLEVKKELSTRDSDVFSTERDTTEVHKLLVSTSTTQSSITTETEDLKSIEELNLLRSDEIILEAEKSVEVKTDELLSPENSTTELISNSAKPVTTTSSENLDKMLSSEGEKLKNVSVEENFTFEDKNVTRETVEGINDDERNSTTLEVEDKEKDSEEAESRADVEPESSSSSILTTISDFIFSSTTTSPQNDLSEPSSESSSEDEKLITTESVPASEEDSGEDTKEEKPEIHKIELLKANLDSLPTNDVESTDIEANSSEVDDEPLDDDKKEDDLVSSTKSPDLSKPENTDEAVKYVEISDKSKTDPKESTELVNGFTELPTKEPEFQVRKPVSDRYVSGSNKDTIAAVQFLHYHDKASSEQCFKLVDAHWNYATNLTEENKKKQLEQTLEYSLFHKEAWKNATSFAWKSFNDTHLRRWFKSLSVLGTAALPEDKLNEFNRLKAEMKNTYSTAKVCPYISPEDRKRGEVENPKDCNLTLEPDLTRILTKSRDYEELTHVWKAWRDAAGKPIRDKYLRFVNLSNEAASLNGFPDTGDMWREAYESETFEEDLEALWEQLRPLYEHLHAYVRRRLIQQYGTDKIKENGPIPAHLFGNMWAQSWVSLLDITQPFLGKPSVDVTPVMEAKNLSALEMFKISEEFFISLGLKPMPEEFWKHSLIEKPKDREIICHASAWDFCNGKDYRIKQCTDITMEDLITVHHEMGHIQYFLQYARQPNVFREGANPGFHEAIGDVLALSVSTPNHLQKIGLLEEVADDPEGDLNFLLRTALDKVSFLPSGYLIDLWRWGLFSGEIKQEEMNTKWWDLRLKYQGICPPVKREDTDFDPGAKYHVPGNVPYIRYFVSFVIQFQFHKVLCDAAGHTGPLYKCDIYRSKEAGQILSQVMELGSSHHWSEAMKIMTGGATNKMDAGPILEYFEPLLNFLSEQNKNETLGWLSSDSTICP